MSLERRDVLTGLGIAGATAVTGSSVVSAEHTDGHGDSGAPRVRAVQASPDAPDVDVFVDGEKVLADLPFRSASPYLEVTDGEREVKITAAGDPDTVAFDGTVEVESGTDYSLAAVGNLSEDSFEVLTLVDDNEADYWQNQGSVRAVHASPDAPAVDCKVLLTDWYATTVSHGLEFTDVGEYEPFSPYEQRLLVTADDTVVADDTLFIAEATSYTAYITGYASPDDEPADAELEFFFVGESADGGEVVDSDDETDTGQVRVAHASPDAPNVDVFLNDDEVLSDVAFTTVSEYLDVPAGEQTVKITTADDPETVPLEGPVTVEAGTAYTVAAVGELAEDSFEPKVLVDDFSQSEDKAGAVRVLHASPDAGPVDVTAADGDLTVVDDIDFKSAAEYVELDEASDVTVEVRPDSEGNDNPFDAEFEGLDLTGVNTAIATGYFTARDEPTDEQFTLVQAADETTG